MLKTTRSSHKKIFPGLFCLLFSFHSLGQQQHAKSERLVTVIRNLEQKFDVKFSYINEDMESFELHIPDKLVTLSDILAFLGNRLQLKIENLNGRYYTITKKTLVSICGRVLDNFAKNNVTGATVEVLGTDRAITTDLNGTFSFDEIPRNTSLKIRYLGYVTQYISVDKLTRDQGCSKILMVQNYQQLEEVLVYKFLTTGIRKEKDASITLNTSDFGILPGLIEPDILQTVQALPGIKSIDETVSDINVRGGTNDQNLILWNGIKMYQSGHFFGLISAFNPYLTDKVTVLKNGTPTEYGDGVSSVIQMETDNEISGVFVGGAGFNFISGDIYGQIPLNKNLAIQFSARRSTTDFLNTPTYNKFFDRAFQDSEVIDENEVKLDRAFRRNENFFFYDFTGKVLYNFNDNHKLRLNFIGIANDLDFEETNLGTNETTNSVLEQTNLSFGGQLTSRWTNRFYSDLTLYSSRYNLDALNLFSNQIQLLLQNNQVLEKAIKLDTAYEFSKNFTWTNGYQFIETGITNTTEITTPPFNSKIKGVVRTHAPYTEAAYSTENNRFIGRAGMRLNYVQNPGSFNVFILEPRLNLNIKLANYLRGEILGEFKSQTTNQIIDLEQNFLGIEKRRWTLSDGNTLPITKSKQGSIGINYEKNGFYMGLEGFYKRVDDISTRTQGFQSQNQFNGEIGSYDVRGVELLMNKKGHNYSAWFSYAYNKNDHTFDAIDPNSFPNNLDIRHTLTFAGTYTHKNLKLGLSINYRTGNPFTEPLDGDLALDTSVFPAQIDYKSPNSGRLPEYTRIDASAIYKFNISSRVKANAGISVLNMTDRKNHLNKYYRLTEDNQIETVESVSLDITPNASFRVSF